MTNFERLKIEIKGIDLLDGELIVYLMENDLNDTDEYQPESNTNKRNILKTALSILESIANNPQLMKSYKTEDITVFQFHQNLQARIDTLDKKIRTLADDNNVYNDGATFAYMFNDYEI